MSPSFPFLLLFFGGWGAGGDSTLNQNILWTRGTWSTRFSPEVVIQFIAKLKETSKLETKTSYVNEGHPPFLYLQFNYTIELATQFCINRVTNNKKEAEVTSSNNSAFPAVAINTSWYWTGYRYYSSQLFEWNDWDILKRNRSF